jgi:hypothetical protein
MRFTNIGYDVNMTYVTGVSKVSSNRKGRNNKNTKRFYMVFYVDSNGNFHTKRIKWYEVPWYKMQICKIRKFHCSDCQEKFTLALKKGAKPLCPNCLN